MTFRDGTYRCSSCGGYMQSFDAQGKRTDSNHCGCDDGKWNDLIYAYGGHRSARMILDYGERAIRLEDHALILDILGRMTQLQETSSCRFPGERDDAFWVDGRAYTLASVPHPYIRVDDQCYAITEADRNTLYTIFTRHLSYWCGSDLEDIGWVGDQSESTGQQAVPAAT